MLRSLEIGLGRKKKKFAEEQALLATIKEAIDEMLLQTLRMNPKYMPIRSSYHFDEKILFLVSEGKALANELLALTPELIGRLKKKDISVRKIVIR